MIIIKTISEWRLALTVLFFVCVSWWLTPFQTEATLNCNITSTCVSPNITLLRMSSTTNAHVAIGTSTDYGTNLVCCDYVSTMTNACGGTGVVTGIVNLSSTTNAHIETSSLSNYPIKSCLRVATGGYVSSTIQITDCTGYEETIGSMSSTTNSHMGGPSDYLYKICASAGAPPQSLTFNINWVSTISFGTLSPTKTRWIDSDGVGDDLEDTGNVLDVTTNAHYGYVLSVRGDAPNYNGNYITPIGATPTSPAIGTNQFGISVEQNGGLGAASYPYIYGQGYAYAANATTTSMIGSSTVASVGSDNFYIRYIANISPSLAPGNYTTVLTYVVTAQY